MTVQLRRRPAPTVPFWRHALATRPGVELLGLMLAAGEHWRPLTGRQKAALRRALRATLAAVPEDAQDGHEVELPALGADVHPATARSLCRRGLATTDGRLTELAVEVVQLADRAGTRHDKRPIRTTHTHGGLL